MFSLLASFGSRSFELKSAAEERKKIRFVALSRAKRKCKITAGFALAVVLILSGSFVVHRVIAPSKTTTRKTNVYGNCHMHVVDEVVDVCSCRPHGASRLSVIMQCALFSLFQH